MSTHDNIGSEKIEDLIFLKELVEAGCMHATVGTGIILDAVKRRPNLQHNRL